MLQLLIDVKKEIACNSEEVWYQLWRYDISFNRYASTDEGKRKFIELFTINDKNSTRLFGKLNSIYDQPAIIYDNGTKKWYKNGNRHRDNDLPAVIWSDGTKKWYKNGNRHRDNDLPAVIWSDGSKEWYQNGKRYRDNDKPAAIYPNGPKYWYQDGKLHRDNDLPAIICSNGIKCWYRNGKRHRIDKPAVIYDDVEEWWENGVKIR